MLERTFQTISDKQIDQADQQSYLVALGWRRGKTWAELVHAPRVLIISEAGAGKTFECREQAQRLWNAGEAAFFIELAALGASDLRDLLSQDEEKRLDAWLISQSEQATFFLDSIDELQLSRGSFERALKRLNKGIGTQLSRARIVITTRPVEFDQQLVRRLLPVPEQKTSEANEESFAQAVMRRDKQRSTETETVDAAWLTVALMPLSDAQIVAFARTQGVEQPTAMLTDLQKRNAQEFARRPQDLIELCADWRMHKRIRTHAEQVAANVRIKLQARTDRPEGAPLSVERAIEGASRLALAMLVTRRLTIRHSAASDVGGSEATLDPAIVLFDWALEEQKTLLERALFGFASYCRASNKVRAVRQSR